MAFLEEIVHPDARFPFIFHTDTLTAADPPILAHWHRKLEILCTVSGSGWALVDGEHVPMTPGSTVIIPPGSLHSTQAEESHCRYHCLIVDLDFLIDKGLWQNNNALPIRVQDPETAAWIERIAEEMNRRAPYYKPLVLALSTQLLVDLYRRHQNEPTPPGPLFKTNHLNTVRQVIAIIDREFSQPLSLDHLCQSVGLSKYYFCHIFKQTTGQTVTSYINRVRCDVAHRLLTMEGCNVSEAAEQCGFHNLSYFTKVYCRHYGHSPSQEKKALSRGSK